MAAQIPEPTATVIHTDQVEKEQINAISANLSAALKQPVKAEDLHPVQNQFPLNSRAQEQVSNFEEEERKEEQKAKFGHILPILLPRVRIARAGTFLQKKLELLSKKTGNNVGIK